MDSCVDSCLSECCEFLLCSLIVVILRVSTVLVLGLVCKPMIMEMILAGKVSNHCIRVSPQTMPPYLSGQTVSKVYG